MIPPAFRWPICCSDWAHPRKSSSRRRRRDQVLRCGFTQADFKKAGRLGCCPECYETFAEGLEGLLKTMHKGTRHVGKVPESLREPRHLSGPAQAAPKETGQSHRGRGISKRRPLRCARSKKPTPKCDSAKPRPHELSTDFSPPAETAPAKGPHDRIVMSSRVRLARNLKDAAFPGWAKKPERVRVLELIRPAVERIARDEGAHSPNPWTTSRAGQADPRRTPPDQPRTRRERRWQRPGLEPGGRRLCVMINEEDHLRMQALRPGLQLRQAWYAIDRSIPLWKESSITPSLPNWVI